MGFGTRITQIERIITDYTTQGQRSCYSSSPRGEAWNEPDVTNIPSLGGGWGGLIVNRQIVNNI